VDFPLESNFKDTGKEQREAACASKQFFGPGLRATGAQPLLWTVGLMAPEA
jgi:hypothetical protein